MAKRAKASMQFYADFKPIEEALGAAQAMYDAASEDDYLDDLVKVAWNIANEDFNQQAAAYAVAGGNIRHMFEWGTLGINRHRTNMRPNPMSENARLWKPLMVGKGLNQQLDYVFKPSVAFVPKPTKGETGMDLDTIAMLRDHVFYNKAMVMESGMTVTIRPVEAEFLLLPMYKGVIPPNARPHDIKRGYTLSKGPLTLRPGARSVGQFNAFWGAYWQGEGNEILNRSVGEQIEADFKKQIERPARGQVMRPIPGAVKHNIITSAKRAKRVGKMKARERRALGDDK